MNLIDLNALYKEYLKEWYFEQTDRGISAKKIERALASQYSVWALICSNALASKTPTEFCQNLTDELLMQYFTEFGLLDNAADVVIEELINRKHLSTRVTQLLDLGGENFLLLCCEVLQAQDCPPYDVYAKWILNDEIGESLRRFSADCLSAVAEQYVDFLLEDVEILSYDTKAYIADVVYKIKSDRVYELLAELFEGGESLGVFSMYLAEQGDIRALPLLKRAAQSCGYADYIDIRNAVERLGFDFDVERDFSLDAEYINITNS